MRGFAAEALDARIQASGLREAVEVTGWIPRSELYELYRRAWAFVYPSRFEGFGMPVAEAMAAGVPLACSDIEPLRDIAGDSAIYFAPGDEPGIARALQVLVSDPALCSRLVAKARERAARFTWEAAAAATRSVLEEAASAGRRR
jgi:glycosyltransferase involved in cell wall biosynthesis